MQHHLRDMCDADALPGHDGGSAPEEAASEVLLILMVLVTLMPKPPAGLLRADRDPGLEDDY
jgi:hypothetical protein